MSARARARPSRTLPLDMPRRRSLSAILPGLLGLLGLLASGFMCSPSYAPWPGKNAQTPFHYDVVLSSDLRFLDVDLVLPRGPWDSLGVEDDADKYVVDLAALGGELTPPYHCTSETCALHYRFALADAAKSFASADVALAVEGGYVSPPSAWLLHPRDGLEHPYTLRVRGKFAIGLPQKEGAYFGNALELVPFAALGDFRMHPIALGDATMTLAISQTDFSLGDDGLSKILGDAARPVAELFGSYPSMLVVVVPKNESLEAKTLGGGGASIFLPIAKDASGTKLRSAWVPTHEMVHVGFPNLGFPHQWFEEGMATYLEPLIRVRAGSLSADDRFRELVTSAPQGQPQAGDEGLESTHTWGRTYWGGALFFLSADVEIRVRTQGKKSIVDVFRAIAHQHGSVAVQWDLARVLDVGDEATGLRVLHEHFDRYAKSPGKFEVDALFRKLGVSVKGEKGETVTYDDGAELAWVRKQW